MVEQLCLRPSDVFLSECLLDIMFARGLSEENSQGFSLVEVHVLLEMVQHLHLVSEELVEGVVHDARIFILEFLAADFAAVVRAVHGCDFVAFSARLARCHTVETWNVVDGVE